MKKKDVMEIVRESGMSENPGFYSGRGAIISDLNDKTLEKLYQKIEGQYGLEVVKHFVQMVGDIPRLTATDFLLTLYRLQSNGWIWDKSLLGNQKGIYPTSEGSAFWTVASVLGGMNQRDETYYIRNDFLRRHGYKPC